MPFPIAAAIAGGASLFNTISGSVTNRSQQKENLKMYQIQRQDALSDYNRMIEYNSPQEQMRRFKAAGLNPNLIYGQQTVSPTIRSSEPTPAKLTPPSLEVSSLTNSLLAGYDIKLKTAQADNLTVQNEVLQQEATLKAAQTLKTLSEGKTTDFDLQMKNELKQISLEAAKASLDQTKAQTSATTANTQFTLDQNERAKALQAPTMQKAAEEILNLRKQRSKTDADIRHTNQAIENLKNTNILQDLDIKLRKLGINPNDPTYMRILGQAMDALGKINIKSPEEAKALGKALWNAFPLLPNLK